MRVLSGSKCWCGNPETMIIGDEGGPDYQCNDSVNHDPRVTGRVEHIKTLYVAGPMSGHPENNYPAFRHVDLQLVAVGFKVVNPVNVNPPERCHYIDLIREDLRVMLDCDGVAVLEGWWESTGARNEVNVAGLLKMPVRPWEEWVKRGPATRPN